jgi:hypothetical protein
MDIIQNLETNDIFTTDERSTVFMYKPSELVSFPNIGLDMINTKYLSIQTHENIKEYFESMFDDSVSLHVIDGIHLNSGCDSYYCDYCKTNIKENWFFCYHCYKDMCKMCHEETNEEIAVKNGAKNYKKREEDLNMCRSHNKIVSRNIRNKKNPSSWRSCDLCHETIDEKHNFYTAEEDYDICLNCYQNSDDARNIVETKDMSLFDLNDKKCYLFNSTDFGSMLYWIPIIGDTETCHVLMNLNPNDKNYGKICLQSCDDHGRFGYFIVRDENYDLNKILMRLKEITDKGTFEYQDYVQVEPGVYGDYVVTDEGNGWDHSTRETIKAPKYEWITKTAELGSKYHSGPIHLLMEELNMPVYYG